MKQVILVLDLLEFSLLKLTMDAVYGGDKETATQGIVGLQTQAPNTIYTLHNKFMASLDTFTDEELKEAMKEAAK